MQTRVTGLLKTEYPIIQGGMAWVADYHLAAAVSNGGGLGMIGAANAPAEWVAEQIREVRKRTDRPFGVNIMLMSPHADEVARTVARERVPVVTTGAGNPEQYMTLWKEKDIRVIPVIASVAMAKRMEKCGADAVVAEGYESGGHVGESTTMTLVPQVCEYSCDRGRRHCRRKRNCSSPYAWCGRRSDGNAFCSDKGMSYSSGLQRTDFKSKRY